VVGALDVALDLPLASLGSRCMAWFIDWLGALLIYGLSILLLQLLTSALDLSPEVILVCAVVGWFAVDWLWILGWELATNGQTMGKRLLGLRVVRLDGTRPGALAFLLRNLLRPLDNLPLCYSVGSLSVLISQRHQRLGDMVAGTLVVTEARAASSAAPKRWPSPLPAEDMRLLEAWFAREPSLLPEVRSELAERMVRLCERRWPDFLPPEGAPEERLRLGFAVEGQVGP
jgi:uncharacterized RDD family membrane protein YckC